MFSSNSSIISEDSLIYPRLNMIYEAYIHTTFMLSTMMFPLMLYVVITKSTKEMGSLKRYFCFQIAWSYLFDLAMTTFLPIPLCPFWLGIVGSPLARLLGPIAGNFQLEFVIFSAVGMCHAMCIAALYRISKFSHRMFFNKLYGNKKIGHTIQVITFFAFAIGVVGPIVLARVPIERAYDVVIQKAPFMEQIFNTYVIFGYETTNHNNFWITIFIIEIIVIVLVGCSAMALINIICLRLIRIRAKTMTKKTMRLHMMLYKALTIQMVVGALFLVIPTGIASTSVYLEFKYMDPTVIICIMIASSHAVVEYMGVIYFVKHYRNFFLEWIRKILRLVSKFVVPTNQILPETQLSSTVQSKSTARNLNVVSPPRRISQIVDAKL